MNNFTHYRTITRDPAGVIGPVSGWSTLGPKYPKHSGIIDFSHHVVSVEPDHIAGWGLAKAIGMVQTTMNGENIDPPYLALLT